MHLSTFARYPKLQKLITLHSDLVADHAHPPTYLEADLRSFAITSLLPVKYDCILIDPPLEEYTKDHPTHAPASWSWDEIAELPIPQIASNPGFVWLWVGSGKADENGVSGLDKGREILAKWGYRRCEDIVWLKTNTRKPGLEVSSGSTTELPTCRDFPAESFFHLDLLFSIERARHKDDPDAHERALSHGYPWNRTKKYRQPLRALQCRHRCDRLGRRRKG